MLTRRQFLKLGLAAGAGLVVSRRWNVERALAAAGSPRLTKYVDPLPIPGVLTPGVDGVYSISMDAFSQKLHRDLPPTPVWGYNGSYPGASFDVQRGQVVTVKWTNNLPNNHPLPIDFTLNWANPANLPPATAPGSPSGPIPVVPHLHGGFTLPQHDGHPEAWFTPGIAKTGMHFISDTYTYYNDQQAATLWYHDHAMGITRLNVYAGLAGFYLVRDPVEAGLNLPAGPYEIPLVIQDRQFNPNGTLFYPNVGITPTHPVWVPEFFGDTPLVNGKAYPFLSVEPRRYRFRILNGSQARFYNLWFDNGKNPVPFHQIGTDGGLGFVSTGTGSAAVRLTKLLIAPGERADIIFDFSTVAPGTVLTLKNNAKTPYPGGRGGLISQIMQFRVNQPLQGTDTTTPAAALALPAVPPLPTGVPTRSIYLKENMDPVLMVPLEVLLNGMHFADPITENPTAGSTEVWQFINLTVDAHPMHMHLVQFQILNRQPFDAAAYLAALAAGNPAPTPVFTGPPIPPAPNEAGWKDTAQAYPGQILRVIAKFDMPPRGTPVLPMGISNPQYVYHCHILEHEDNEMMRPFEVV